MDDVYSPEEQAILGRYVSNLDRPVFALYNLPEEVIAVLFAYYSRSRATLRQNLLKLIRDDELALFSFPSALSGREVSTVASDNDARSASSGGKASTVADNDARATSSGGKASTVADNDARATSSGGKASTAADNDAGAASPGGEVTTAPLDNNAGSISPGRDASSRPSVGVQTQGLSGGALTGALEKAKAFHEKWVVGYGHASVAEHGVAHLALEDISILASKVVEDARLASFTEKSTRYVQFDRRRYLKPRAIMASRFAADYVETADALFDGYLNFAEPLTKNLEGLYPRGSGQPTRAYDTALRARAYDVLRYLLPAATLTNVGMTVNGRSLEQLISKMLSHPLEEVRTLGGSVRQEGGIVLPTLLKHAGRSEYRARTPAAIDAVADDCLGQMEGMGGAAVTLAAWTPEAEIEVITAILYPHSRLSFSQIREQAQGFSEEQKRRVIDEALRQRGGHDSPLRALEHVHYTFDLLLDFGAYRDIQRHRMATQLSQPLGVDHGYEVPEEIEAGGLVEPFERLMEKAAGCYRRMAGSLLFEASYIVPLAFRRRVSFTWNLRSLIHFIELRSAPQGHRSYRRIAQEVFRQVAQVHPFIARYIRVVLEDSGLERLASEIRNEVRS